MARRRRVSRGWTARKFSAAGILIAGALTVMLVIALDASWLIAALLGMNVTAFGFYGYDKSRARSRGSRVPENTLHFLAFAGGSPGALLGQTVFRHKTRKRSFQVIFWLIVVLQAAAIVYIYTGGRA